MATVPFRSIGTRQRLVDRVAAEIERMIIEGELQPDIRLPPQRQLAEQMGVSRTVIREAVSVLTARGLLRTEPGVGSTVQRVQTDQIVRSLRLVLGTQGNPISFAELHEVRTILELEGARLAALRATTDDLASLKQIMQDMESALDDNNLELFAAKDAAFHFAIAQAAHNSLLEMLSKSVRDLLQQYLMTVMGRIDIRRHVLPYHLRILDRVVAADSEGSCQAMQEHLERVKKNEEEAFDAATARGQLFSSVRGS